MPYRRAVDPLASTRNNLWRHVAASALALFAASQVLAADTWRVVILQGGDPSQPAFIETDRGFRHALSAAAPDRIEFYADPLDGQRFKGADLAPEYLALLTKKYSEQEIDLVVGVGDFALEFTEKHHQQLWPGKPVLIYGIEEQRLLKRGLPAAFASVPVRIDVEGTLSIAEALQPGAQRLVVVSGVAPLDQVWAQRTAAAARERKAHRWVVESWSGLPLPELLQRLAALDRRTAVVVTTMLRDRDGRATYPVDLIKPMAEASGAPIYGWYSTYMQQGLTAGAVLQFEDHGRRAGELAGAILRAETGAANARVAPPAARCTANASQLERHGLDAGALPSGCELVQRPPSLWRDHRGEMLIGLAIVALQAATIAGLLLQRRRRHAAEDDSARRRVELNRAARVATVSELSASVTHEVGQPISAIVVNAEVIARMLEGTGATQAELLEIVADVRRDALRASEVVRRLRALLENHTVEFIALDLRATLDEALALLASEARRRGIALEARLGSGEAALMGDRVQLQQVLLNLVLNAMDAMHGTAPEHRSVQVTMQPHADGFELEVADRGHGISPQVQVRLFESLFTTKPHGMGLGLSIVRTIVAAHGGRVSARSRIGGGSVFTVWLPGRHLGAPAPSPVAVAAVSSGLPQRL